MKVFAAIAFASAVCAANWGFEDGTVAVAAKGAEAVKQKLSSTSPLSTPVVLPPSATLKLSLTAHEGKSGKRPHQAFLTLRELDTGLEESFALSVKDSGKAKVDVSQKDLPHQFLTSSKPLAASIVIGSFGSSTPYNSPAFSLAIQSDATSPPSAQAPPERYASKPEIHHIFKADPRSAPTVVSLFFTLAILATLPALLGAWALLGGNVAHVGKAFGVSPLAHGLFFGSIVAMEGVFFLYYTTWNLFQTLPAAAAVGIVAFISGSRALTEVQERRLQGER